MCLTVKKEKRQSNLNNKIKNFKKRLKCPIQEINLPLIDLRNK